jgi:hypothetical protein
MEPDTVQKASYHSAKLNTIENVIEFLELNNSKKYNSFKKYDIERIVKFLKKTQCHINTLTEENNELQIKTEKTQKIGKAHTDRIEIFSQLFKNFKKMFEPEYYLDGGLHGSWIRQLFELPYAIANGFKYIGYGNPIGHDLDLILMNTMPFHIDTYAAKFIKIMKSFQEHVTLSTVSDLIKPIVIANKTLIQVSDSTILNADIKESDPIGKKVLTDIPHYIFKFKDNEDNSIFEVDVLAYKPRSRDGWTNADFNVNQYLMNDKGIMNSIGENWNTPVVENEFFDFLDSIKNREAICKIDFKEIIDNTKRWGMVRKEKVAYFMQIAFMLTQRFKILNVGYTDIFSNTEMLDYSINKTDECAITGCQPPYYEITLKCLHKLSIMSFIGILEESVFDSSEAIRCPICRSDFDINLVDKKPNKYEYFDLMSINNIINKKLENCFLEEKEEAKVQSNDSEEYIKSLITKKQPNTDNSVLQPIRIGRGRRNWETS